MRNILEIGATTFVLALGLGPLAAAEMPTSVTLEDFEIRYLAGTGADRENAISILGAPNVRIGVQAQYSWLRLVYPGYEIIRQTPLGNAEKQYSLIEFRSDSVEVRTVCFDITEYQDRPFV